MKNTSILHIIPELEKGNVSYCALNICKALKRYDFENIYVISEGGSLERVISREIKNLTLIPNISKKKGAFNQENCLFLQNYILMHNIQIIHTHSLSVAWLAYHAIKSLKNKNLTIKLITVYYKIYPPGLFNYKKKYNSILLQGDTILVPSDCMYYHLKKFYPEYSNKFQKITYGVDTDIFSPSQVSQPRIINLLNQLNIPPHCPIITVPGAIHSRKNYESLIKAFAYLQGKSFRCIFAGKIQDKKYFKILQNLLKKTGEDFQFIFVNYCVDMPALYILSDFVICLCPEEESFSHVAAETLCMGKPLIISNRGISSEMIPQNHRNIFEFGKQKNIYEAIHRYYNLSSQEYQTISKDNLDYALTNLTLKALADRIVSIYKKTLDNEKA